MKINEHYHDLAESYLFSTIADKVEAYTKAHPDQEIIRMGIGDVTQPLCPAVIQAMQQAVAEMGVQKTFHGYGPEQGYAFLKRAIQGYYQEKGVDLALDEIFISDGAKSDLGNILDLFSADNTVCVPDPVYPVYVDTNVMAGRRIVYADANESNGFAPLPQAGLEADIVYLCSPNNPTGAVYTKEQLKAWVEYALEREAVLLFDAAYEAFIEDVTLPRSIYEIEGAERCAIEFCSFSKTAGFNQSIFNFTADVAFAEYKVCVVPANSSTQDAGTVIPTTAGSSNTSGSAGNYPAATNIQVTITGTDLETASPGDGAKIVKVFVKNEAGTWSVA